MEKLISELFQNGELQIQETNFLPECGLDFWQSVILNIPNQTVISAGFHKDKMQSRKIAIAEYLERTRFTEFRKSSEEIQKKWGLNLIPTACGFAAGFQKENTIRRSIGEAAERWVMSKWIDDDLLIEEIPSEIVTSKLDKISQFFVSQFEQVLFFKKKLILPFNDQFMEITVAQTMGLTKGGIFPGSSAQISDGDYWQHALLETYRHFLFVKNNPISANKFPDDKIRFFANNKNLALEKIYKNKNSEWPNPQISFHNSEDFNENKYFISRTILNGWKSWNQGPIERFLY